jgi:hypothetical protein
MSMASTHNRVAEYASIPVTTAANAMAEAVTIMLPALVVKTPNMKVFVGLRSVRRRRWCSVCMVRRGFAGRELVVNRFPPGAATQYACRRI